MGAWVLINGTWYKTGTAGSTSISYDVLGRPITLGHDITGTANDISFGFTYNPASQPGSDAVRS